MVISWKFAQGPGAQFAFFVLGGKLGHQLVLRSLVYKPTNMQPTVSVQVIRFAEVETNVKNTRYFIPSDFFWDDYFGIYLQV